MKNTKYKFVETQGCTAFGFDVDGKDDGDLSNETKSEVVDYLCAKIKQGVEDGAIELSDVVRVFPETDYGTDKEPCSQCFDTVSWTVWEI